MNIRYLYQYDKLDDEPSDKRTGSMGEMGYYGRVVSKRQWDLVDTLRKENPALARKYLSLLTALRTYWIKPVIPGLPSPYKIALQIKKNGKAMDKIRAGARYRDLKGAPPHTTRTPRKTRGPAMIEFPPKH